MSSQHAGEFLIRIKEKLDAISSLPPKYTIFKVHELLRRENEMAYEPEILSIGPYHRGKARLQAMEDLKWRWFKARLEQLGECDATKYVQAMKSLEAKARQCYSESTSNVTGDDFVEMILLDGCFIIQLMRKCLNYDPTDPFLEEEWVVASLIRDILLFENQIPLFVLEELFSMIRLRDHEPVQFHDLALEFLNAVLEVEFSTIPNKTIRLSNPNDVPHILGFLHDLLGSLAVSNNTHPADDPSNNETSKAKRNLQHAIKAGFRFINKGIITHLCRRGQFHRQGRDIQDFLHDEQNRPLNIENIPSATQLHATGVQFRSKKVWNSPFEISFNNAVMEIPTFIINDATESFYRNMIAFEQYSKKSSDRCVVLHANLMDCLIDSAEDVALLRKCGIVGNALGDDEVVSTIFNKLVNNVIVSNRDSRVHAKFFKEVNAYRRKRRHRWMAKLRLDYFNSPWAWISVLAASLLLLLTLTQTVFSILAVV